MATRRPPSGAPLDLAAAARGAPAAPSAPRPSVAATGTGDARADYDAAYAYILQKQYEQAEMSFRQFLQSHPRDRLAPDATYLARRELSRRATGRARRPSSS